MKVGQKAKIVNRFCNQPTGSEDGVVVFTTPIFSENSWTGQVVELLREFENDRDTKSFLVEINGKQAIIGEEGLELVSPKIIKRYSLEVILDEAGDVQMNSENEGFSAFDIIGILEHKKQDILNQLSGRIKPDIVSRKVIES